MFYNRYIINNDLKYNNCIYQPAIYSMIFYYTIIIKQIIGLYINI